MPADRSLTLSLPALDGEKWLALLKSPAPAGDPLSAARFRYPEALTLRTPAMTLGGQVWHQLALTRSNVAGSSKVAAKGKKINGTLTMAANAPWRAELAYLCYNPTFATAGGDAGASHTEQLLSDSDTFAGWPALSFTSAGLKGRIWGRSAPLSNRSRTH